MSFQLMEGSGLPLAWHSSVTLEPSFTTTSRDRLMIFVGTVKNTVKCGLFFKKKKKKELLPPLLTYKYVFKVTARNK